MRELDNVKTRGEADAFDEKLNALAAQLNADDARLEEIARVKAESQLEGKGKDPKGSPKDTARAEIKASMASTAKVPIP